MIEQAKVVFYDGQRVRREDLEYLQENLLNSLQYLQSAIGQAGISWGLKVVGENNTTLNVGAGLAFDGYGRLIIIDKPVQLTINLGDEPLYVYIKYIAEVVSELNGQPSRIGNNYQLIVLGEADVGNTQDLPVAQIVPREEGYDVIQKGEWYIPPNNASHSGRFYEDALGRWRYDGDPIASGLNPDFDSGWLHLEASSDSNVVHNLGSMDLLVQLQIKLGEGVISNQGSGSEFYYELHDTSVIRLFNDKTTAIEINAKLWKLDAITHKQLNPVADAGEDISAEYGESFGLDGSDSLAFEGRSVVRYRWTLIE